MIRPPPPKRVKPALRRPLLSLTAMAAFLHLQDGGTTDLDVGGRLYLDVFSISEELDGPGGELPRTLQQAWELLTSGTR